MTAMIGKEWRRLMRAPSTPWALLAYLLVPLLISAGYLTVGSNIPNMGYGPGWATQQMAMMGGQALSNVATWQTLILAVAASWMAAGVLAAEVEERTLDPLLASGGRLFSLVSAKLAGVISFLWLLVLAGLPVFTLPFLVGGVNWAMLGRAVAMELGTVVLMSALGLMLSAFGRRAGSAAMAGLALGLALTLGLGMAGGALPGSDNTYNNPELLLRMGMMAPGMQPGVGGPVPRLQYVNPLVGLNTALNQPGAQGLFGLPGTGAGPVYKEYRLWQVQLAGSVVLAVLAILAAWLVMTVRLRWRSPRLMWLKRLRRRKGVAVSG